jgi:serine protease Do
MKKLGVIAIVLLSSLGNVLWAGELKPREKRALELKPAVVLVLAELKVRWFPGTQLQFVKSQTEAGSGFLFRPDGYLLTNGHVVADVNLNNAPAQEALKKQLQKQFYDALVTGTVRPVLEQKIGRKLTDAQYAELARAAQNLPPIIDQATLHVILQNGKIYQADILQYSNPNDLGGKDVAVLKIPADNLPTVRLANSDNVRLQDSIMVIGYPATAAAWGTESAQQILSMESALEPSANDGHISALKVENIGTPLLQSDVNIFHGNSGGPVFNDQGEVIGLATMNATEAQGFAFIVPINTAMEFVRQTGASPESGAFNRHWASALDLYDQGKCDRAISEFDNVSQIVPDLKDVQRFRSAAVACVDKMSWYDKLTETAGLWPIIGLLAIIVIGAGVWMAMNKSGAAKPAAQPPVQPAAKVGAGAGVGAGAAGSFGHIQFTSGSLSGRTFPIGKDGVWIGRDSGTCSVVLQDDSISGQHAWVVPADGNIVVIDKGSTNGTYVNSADSPRISKMGLRNGDRVFLGHKGSAFTYFNA